MRRLIAPAALTAVLLLAGCSASPQPGADSTPATATSPSASAEPTIARADLEQGFVEAVRQEVGGELGSVTDADLLKLGDSVCQSLEVDVPPADTELALTDSGFSKNVAVNIITGAGVLLCSDQAPKVLGGW